MGIFGKKPIVVEDEQPIALTTRRSTPSVPPATEPATAPTSTHVPVQPPAPAAAPSLFAGPRVDIDAIYKAAKLAAEELDRVARAEQLLALVPSTETRTREVVDATFRAFGVDRTKILEASSKQLHALEAFLRFSQEQTQRSLDANAKRIQELEAEIAQCRQVSATATSEGEERARVVNGVLLKVQRVLDFFGDTARGPSELDLEVTAVSKPETAGTATGVPIPRPVRRTGAP